MASKGCQTLTKLGCPRFLSSRNFLFRRTLQRREQQVSVAPLQIHAEFATAETLTYLAAFFSATF